jgi:hypothetical protein
MTTSSRFLFLKGLILNKHCIHHITSSPEKYVIYMQQNLNGWFFLGTGSINSEHIRVEIKKSTDQEEYEIVSRWLKAEQRPMV